MRLILIVLGTFALATFAHAAPARLELGGANWQVHESDKPEDVTPATVPGCVHLDLLNAKKIPDPFYQQNEKSLQWISDKTWVFTRHFTVPAEVLSRQHVELRFDGLETIAHVELNGRPLGDADNMFRTWTFDVKDKLHVGDNDIAVTFTPLKEYEHAQDVRTKGKGPGMFTGGLGEVRTEICADGWDFGPKFITAGIWKPVAIVSWDTARIATIGIDEDLHSSTFARLKLDVHVDGNTAVRASARVSSGGKMLDTKMFDVGADGVGRTTLTITDPHLWWPTGMGAQPMYDVTVELDSSAPKMLDQTSRRIGLRTIKLLPKTASRPLDLEVNGRPIFSRGAAWIPCEMFPTRVTHEHLLKLLGDAKSVNMNMIRCWGGGYYEEDDFYNICDELGLLVWCDFKFACKAYPGSDPLFMANVKAEFDDNITRLRHHPSIAVWSGNNEVLGLVTGYKVMRQEDYDKLFHELFTSTVHELAPNGATVPGSPEMGDEHNWWVWHVGASFEKYLEGHGWMTEFGFQSFPEPRTVETYSTAEDRASVETDVMKAHQKNGNKRGNQMITEMMGRYFKPAKDFDSTLWLSQINQAMGLTLGIRHWRADWPSSSGAIVWQYDDIWPGPTWACVDYYGRWKAIMYRLRGAYAPVMVAGLADEKTHEVKVDIASDVPTAQQAKLRWTLTDVAGKKIEAGDQSVSIPQGTTAVHAWTHGFGPTLKTLGMSRAMLWLDVSIGGKSVARQTVLFDKPKNVDFVDPQLKADVQSAGDGFDVTLSAAHPAMYAWLDLGADASYSDNFVDLPGGTTVIHVKPAAAMTIDQVRAALKVRSLYDTYTAASVVN